jgi:hypothetical protein
MSVSSLIGARNGSQTDLRTRSLLGAAALLLAIIAIRSPGLLFGVLNVDETDFLMIARRVLAGGLPYVDAVEMKPPLAYVAYLPGALVGFRMWPMQLLAIGWMFATLWILKATAKQWTGRDDVGWAAAWLGLLAYCSDIPVVNTELLFNLPASAALFFFVRAEKGGQGKDWFFCGLCAAIATLFKHQAGILIVALLLAQLWFRISDLRAHRALPENHAEVTWVGLGFALPWTLALSFYAARGQLAAFWEWNVFRNLGYISVGATGQPVLRAAKAIVICVLGATPLPWLLSLRGIRGPSDRIRTTLALLLALSWIPVCMGGRFYEHYFLQFVPPLALLGAPVLVKLWDQWPTLSRWARLTLRGLAVLPPLATLVVAFGLGLTHRYPTQNVRAVELARWLDAHSQPVDKLFVWGHFSPIYYLAEREPGTRYLSTSVHMGNFDPHHLPADFDAAAHRSEVDVERTIHDLEQNKPPWIVDTAPADIHDWSKVPLSKFPELADYVATHYDLVATPGGAAVYHRRAAPAFSGLSSAGVRN